MLESHVSHQASALYYIEDSILYAQKIEQENIQVYSQEPVEVKQIWKEELSRAPLRLSDMEVMSTTPSSYQDYRITRLQFEFTSTNPTPHLKVVVPYTNRLSTLQAKHAVWSYYDGVSQTWQALPTERDETHQTLSFVNSSAGIYAIFVNHFWYSAITPNMAAEYPNWTQIRQSKESLGQHLFNAFAIPLEEIEEHLNWIQRQKYLPTVDLQVMDWIYVYELPHGIIAQDAIALYDGARKIPLLSTLREFFYNPLNDGGIIDYTQARFYSTQAYESFHGVLQKDNQPLSFSSEPRPHPIWNALDEFGLLVGVKRLYLEKNADYKERILDVFRYPANSGDEGLTHGIGRELNLIKRFTWTDDSKRFVIHNQSGFFIDRRTLRIDGEPVEPPLVQEDPGVSLIIEPLHQGTSHTVSVIVGIQKHELHHQADEELHDLMYQADGQATPMLVKWVEYIHQVSPILWDQFHWDEGFWDTVDASLTGLGYIPNQWDSSIEVWKTYTLSTK